jgi:hypothetical protein
MNNRESEYVPSKLNIPFMADPHQTFLLMDTDPTFHLNAIRIPDLALRYNNRIMQDREREY